MGGGFPQSGGNQPHAAFALGQIEPAFHFHAFAFIPVILRLVSGFALLGSSQRRAGEPDHIREGQNTMKQRVIDPEITLVPYYPNYEVSYAWYQDPGVCKQVDNMDGTYTMENLKAMYGYLSTHGDCFYIQYRGTLVGDVTLQDNHEISIVICREYQNRHIGRRCVAELLRLAGEKGLQEVKARIYSFNTQSQRMFSSLGFEKTAEEWYVYHIKPSQRKTM